MPQLANMRPTLAPPPMELSLFLRLDAMVLNAQWATDDIRAGIGEHTDMSIIFHLFLMLFIFITQPSFCAMICFSTVMLYD